MDFDEARKIIVTAALDQRIKMWSFKKVLLLQITSNEPVEWALIVNGVDVLLAHSKKLSIFKIKQFGLAADDLEKLAQTEVDDQDGVEIAEHLLRAKTKKRNETLIDSPPRVVPKSPIAEQLALPVSSP